MDLLNGSWGATTDVTHAFQDFPDTMSSHSGDVEEYIITSGHTTPRGSRLGRSQWTAPAALGPISAGGHAMSRVDSSRSIGSSLSQSSQLSHLSSNMKGNTSAFRTGSQNAGTLVGHDSCLLVDDVNSVQPIYWPGYVDTMNGPFVTDASPLHVVPSQTQFGPDKVTDNGSPSSWGFPGSISRTSSPVTIEEPWLQAQGPISPPNSSPEISCQSPSHDFSGPLQHDDMNANGLLPDGLNLPSPLGSRRDGETARNHDLYKNAMPHEDGLFHCPWEGDASCNHKPEKLKCNYDKFVDSHLKPYRCKAEACEGARFSSTACLLRHEREAHGLHGHGEKPFLCHYEGCERGVIGNGFPRQWNLKDHMKRVHNDHGAPGSSPPGPASSQMSAKGRKRKTDSSESHSISSRKSSQKSMPIKENKQPSVKPLMDQWMDHHKALEAAVHSLDKPHDARTMQQIVDIQNRLSVMTKLTSEFNIIPQVDSYAMHNNLDFVSSG